ncbi:MAG: hypothetical protein SW019_09270 [Actinomycetota bacterium]|nr:hypothetical protein [Actinomycetota bacterium]
MSWLLVGLIPGLLMVATFGLQRVESSLSRDTVSAADVAAFLDHAKANGVGGRSGTEPQPPVRGFAPRMSVPLTALGESVGEHPPGPLPTPRYLVPHPNTEFHQTRHADRV